MCSYLLSYINAKLKWSIERWNVLFLKGITSAVPFWKGVDAGYNWGRVGGAGANPCALWKVCCPCFLSELYCTFIEIWTLRRTVVVAVCKIMNSEATGEEKGSGLIMKQFTCSLPLEILSLFTLQGDLFSWNKVGKLEVTIPKIHTEAREELIVEERGSFHKTVVYWAVEWLNILKGVRDLINLGKAAGDRPPVGKRVDRLNGCLLCLILAIAEWAYYLDPHNELDKQWNN